ncbi:MAG: hypothetical protein DMG59_03610 [Acidobacteria bacterium]|nr:MAG: hypothetical protein DMG59_03610 [Acidobacteriota bacterium]
MLSTTVSTAISAFVFVMPVRLTTSLIMSSLIKAASCAANLMIGLGLLHCQALLRRACALFATGVAVLTTRASDGTPHGLTINSFSSLSLEPPLVIVAIDRACSIVEMFAPGGQFAVNILREEQRDLSVRFSALPEGRFSGVPWRPGITGAPVIDGVLGTIECRIMQVLETGDHRLLIGEVVDAMIAEGRPLVFFASGYTGLR